VQEGTDKISARDRMQKIDFKTGLGKNNFG
jgi:hypothetical protein